MTFANTRQVATERLSEVLLYLNHIGEIEPKPGPGPNAAGVPPKVTVAVPPHVNIMKGLFFVQLYGALEKSTSDAVQRLLSKIITLQPKNEHVVIQFNVVSMARRWKSIKDSGHAKAFSQMTDFFAAIGSSDYLGIDETLFSALLQNVWANTLDEVSGALGMASFLSVNERALVNELVENRNAVAHGRESPSAVGQRYRASDLRKRLQEVQLLIFKMIDRFETYFDKREFLQPTQHALYP